MIDLIDISMVTALYLYIFCFFAGFLFMLILYFYVEDYKPEYKHLLLFFLLCLIGALLTSLRNEIGTFLSIIVANTLLITGHTFIPIGIRKIFKMKINYRIYIGIIIVAILSFLTFTYIRNDIVIRIYLLNFFSLIILFYAVYCLSEAKKKHKNLKELMSLSIAAVIVTIILRLANFTINRENTSDFLSHELDSLFIVIIGIGNLFIIPGLFSLFRAIQEKELRNLIRLDPLTGLANRRSLIDDATRVFSLSRREKTYLSVFMIDIDQFKKYNDKYGHLLGDMILRDVAHAVRTQVHRPLDIVSRYGGEEFVVILYDCDERGARLKGNDIIDAVHALPYFLENQDEPLSVSVGYVTTIISETSDLDQIIKQADDYMYQAKSSKYAHIFGDIVKNDFKNE